MVTGCGKTTISLRLARIFHIPKIELDSLHWLGGDGARTF
jgi:gluconate kinase